MDLGLKGKRVIITGGTRGIGRATLDAFLSEGAEVAFCARREKDIEALVKQHKAAGYKLFGAPADVGDRDSYHAFLKEAIGVLGGVDVFVANASAGAQPGDEGFQQALDVDVLSAVRGADAVLPHMAQQKSGSLVFIASVMAYEAMGAPGPYAAMKAALLSYAGQLVEAVGPHGIRVNSVSPGPIHVDDGFWANVQANQPEIYQQFTARHPAGRLGMPEEVADAVLYLSSKRASWISGTNIVVDGGLTKRLQF